MWRIGSTGDTKNPTTVLEVDNRFYRLAECLGNRFPSVSAVTVRDIVDEWAAWSPIIDDAARSVGNADMTPIDVPNWLTPVVYPDKLICIGANYTGHLEEMGVDSTERATHPYAFLKPTSTGLIGYGAQILAPSEVECLDWEGELAVVIGQRAHQVAFHHALDVIAGYMPFNDLSARDWIDKQTPGIGMDWILHKAFDAFSPAGKLMTPASLVDDPQNLELTTYVNDQVMQQSNTSSMVFSIREIIAHLSSVMTLVPGDIIATGTPAGVGYARSPRQFLKAGDVVRVEIEQLGEIANTVATQ